MLNRIMSYFTPSSVNSTSPNLPITNPKPKNNKPKEEKTWVYVWRMTPQNVGHAAIQVGGDTPKETAEQAGEYVSIHPKSIPAIGPTIILPLPATLATSLGADMETEAASSQKEKIDMDAISIFDDKKLSTLPPDYTFEIEGLDTRNMHGYIDTVKEQVESGKAKYQLLPKVNTTGFIHDFFRDGAAFNNFDPIDIELHQKYLSQKEYVKPHANNCTMLVREILNSGGMYIGESKTPWGLTPDGLATELQNLQSKKYSM